MKDSREYVEIAEHYAERGLDGDYGDHEMRMRQLAYAQVMATLAVARATADITDYGVSVGSV